MFARRERPAWIGLATTHWASEPATANCTDLATVAVTGAPPAVDVSLANACG